MKGRDITGQRFGSLVATSRNCQSKNGTWKWNVTCDCGGTEVVFITTLGRSKVRCRACQNGMIATQRTTHGMTNTPEYIVWKGAKARCLNPEAPHYADYGGRGIAMCQRWSDSFENFYADMGARPEGMTLERIDVNGNYEPDNCRWATRQEQANNRRDNNLLTVAGVTATVAEWSRKTGVGDSTIRERLRRGWSPERAIHETMS